MKEFFCCKCRRHKKASLYAFGGNGRAVCVACHEKVGVIARKTEEEKERHHKINVAHGKAYKSHLNNDRLKYIMGNPDD